MSDRLDVMELMRRANPARQAEVPDPSERELSVMEEIIALRPCRPALVTSNGLALGDASLQACGGAGCAARRWRWLPSWRSWWWV